MGERPAQGSAPPSRPWSGGGREELAAAIRRLMTATVAAAAPPEVLSEAARRAAALADELDRHVPPAGPEPTARFADESVQSVEVHTLAAAMPFDMVIGSCNPVAPPLTIEFDPPRAIGHAVFTAPYEGAPGLVHGAVLAGAFDMMLTAANVIADGAGPTVRLSIQYRKPTLIALPARFEAWVTESDGRRTHSRGQLTQGGVVTVEAVGEFVNMGRSRISELHRADHAVKPTMTDRRRAVDDPGLSEQAGTAFSRVIPAPSPGGSVRSPRSLPDQMGERS